MSDLPMRLRRNCHFDDCQEAADEIERLQKLYDVAVADRVRMHEETKHLREAITVAGMALVLCDSTDPDAPVLDGKLWRKACEVIEEVTGGG